MQLTRLVTWLTTLTAVITLTLPASSQDQEALTEAVAKVQQLDGGSPWLAFTVTAASALPSMALGSAVIIDDNNLGFGDSHLATGSAIALTSFSTGLVVHGLMRISERTASDQSAEALLNDSELMRTSGLFYLRDRASKASDTRLLGGILTVAQGLSVVGLGASALQDPDGNGELGYTFISLGIVGMGIGAIHFTGKTRSERLYDEVSAPREQSLRLTPSLSMGPDGQLSVSLSGIF